MKENNRLKKIIDLYVDKGANNDYLHEEMLKTFNSVSKEEKGRRISVFKLEVTRS